MLPVMIAPSLMGIMYRLMLNENIGLVSHLFSMIGFELNLFRPDTIVPVIIILDPLQWTPFVVLILYSGLLGINHELYEVASVDGGTYWTIVFRIILPILTPIIIIAAFLRGIDAFRTFDLIHVLTNGGPGNATTNLSIYIYNIAFKHGNFALANSASVIVIIGLSVVLPFIVRRLTTID